MRTITRLLPAVLLAFAGTAPPCHAQDNVTPTQWTGTAHSSIGNKTFYLYNIGTGKFIKQGGEYGVQGIFMFQGFGTPLTLEKVSGYQYRINSGVVTHNSGKYVGINYPGQTSPSVPWDHSQFLFGIIFDTYESYGGFKRYLTFEKIDGYSSPCVYRIKETISKSSIDFYWGAKMGIDYRTGDLSDDLGNVATFLPYHYISRIAENEKDNYSWILVTEDELKSVHTSNVEKGGGLPENMSYLLKDPFFDRNRTGFDGAWTTVYSRTTEEGDYRYNWRAGRVTNPQTDPWSMPLIQKMTVNGKYYGEYSFASFEGDGYAYTSFTAPQKGYYDLEVRGFYQGGHEAYFFASTTKPGGDEQNTSKVKLQLFGDSAFHKVKDYYQADAISAPGKLLFHNKDNAYTRKVQVYANKGQTVYVGVFKKGATKSDLDHSSDDGKNYYHDTDYVGIDNLQLYFVGEIPFVLDEDKTDNGYMKAADFTGDRTTVVYLKRTFTLNKWNTLVLPIDLTATQIKEAFGEGTKLAEMAGRGGVTGKPSIDFRTVSLEKEGTPIEAGKMYLIKPVKDGIPTNILSQGYTDVKMYTIGRRNIDGSQLPNIDGSPGQGTVNTQVDFMGTYVSLAADAENGTKKHDYLFSGGDMYHLTSPMGIKGFRGWFRDNTGAESIKFNISDGEITSIDEVTRNGAAASGAVYTVDGVKVRANAASLEGLPEGIYIFNGRKHIVK